MIQNESEYQEARQRIDQQAKRLSNQRAAYAQEGYSPEEVKRLTDPFLTFHLQLRDEVSAYEQLKLERMGAAHQSMIDAVCHYRNLAIILGAKPYQMLDAYDRQLCEAGIDPDNTSNGYHVSVNEQLEELADVWDENERLEKELSEARAELEKLRTPPHTRTEN